MAFDGITLKAISSELQDLKFARLDKIYEPNKNEILLGFYKDSINYLLNISIDPKTYRISLSSHTKKNPKVAPNFCMVLRKHLLGLHIKNVVTFDLERIVSIEFEGFDDIDDIVSKKLVVELMGKHCNIILLDDNNYIIDSIKHINSENSTRKIIPHVKYEYIKSTKKNFLETSLEDFKKSISYNESAASQISNTYTGISKTFAKYVLEKCSNIDEVYFKIKKIIDNTDSLKLKFVVTNNDYVLDESATFLSNFSLNFSLDDFYYEKESKDMFLNLKSTLLKNVNEVYKKYEKRLNHILDKLKECENMDKFKIYGELITANLYKIPNKNIEKIELQNYYDNNNLITINLDERFSPSINAKKFFKKYSKLKNASVISKDQEKDTLDILNYLDSVVYEIEAAKSVDDLQEIKEEIDENEVFKLKKNNRRQEKSRKNKNKNKSFNPLRFNIDGYTFLIGRNNKENDYLSLKYAKPNDIWFHTKDIHGSHGILVIDNALHDPQEKTLIKCATIIAKHSKAKLSSNVPVDYCKAKFVKKPNSAKPGMVIYKNNYTLYVDSVSN